MRDFTVSGYDACFLALAQKKNCPLVTYDRRLISAAPHIAISAADYLARLDA